MDNKPIKSARVTTPTGRFTQVALSQSVEEKFGSERAVYTSGPQDTFQIEIAFEKGIKANEDFYKKILKLQKELGVKKYGPKFNPLHAVIKDSDMMDCKNAPENSYVIRAKRRFTVGARNLITLCSPQGERLLDSSMFYDGCYGKLQVIFKTYDHKGAKGVSAQLLTAQFIKDGDPIVYAAEGDLLDAVESYDSLSDGLHDDMLVA